MPVLEALLQLCDLQDPVLSGLLLQGNTAKSCSRNTGKLSSTPSNPEAGQLTDIVTPLF